MMYLLVMNFLSTVTLLLRTILKFITTPILSELTGHCILKKYGQLSATTSFMHDRKQYSPVTTSTTICGTHVYNVLLKTMNSLPIYQCRIFWIKTSELKETFTAILILKSPMTG